MNQEGIAFKPSLTLITSSQQKPNNVIEVRPHERQATLTGLRPYTKYNIAIKAENEVGYSLENSLVLTTQEASMFVFSPAFSTYQSIHS